MGSIFNSCLSPKIQAKITENGRIAIYDANEYIRGIGYPTGTTAPTQRIAPNYSHGPSTPAIVDNNGHIIVEGKVGGRVTSSSNNGTIEFTIKSSSELTVDHVDTGSTYIENHFVLKDDIGTEMPNIAGVFDIKNNTAWTTDITFHRNDESDEWTDVNKLDSN